MTARVVFTEVANEDTRSIYSDLYAKAGKRTVEKYRSAFHRLYDRFADFPESGAPRPKLGPTVRIGVIFPYVVFYRYVKADNAVLILRIIDGRRRITRGLLREPPSHR